MDIRYLVFQRVGVKSVCKPKLNIRRLRLPGYLEGYMLYALWYVNVSFSQDICAECTDPTKSNTTKIALKRMQPLFNVCQICVKHLQVYWYLFKIDLIVDCWCLSIDNDWRSSMGKCANQYNVRISNIPSLVWYICPWQNHSLIACCPAGNAVDKEMQLTSTQQAIGICVCWCQLTVTVVAYVSAQQYLFQGGNPQF